MTAVCPHCHQPYAAERLGVRVTPLKARIIDVIKAAGDIGITKREIHYELYRGYQHERGSDTVRSHVRQINELLEPTDWVMQSEGRGQLARWYLRRRRQGKAAA